MSAHPKILHSGTYWRDFHRNRARRLELRHQQSSRRLSSYDYNALGPLHDQPPIFTFIPNRATPVITTVQNDGTLRHSYDPREELAAAARKNPSAPLPAATKAPNAAKRRKASAADAIAERARTILKNRPDPDEVLLARLTSSTTAVRVRDGENPAAEGKNSKEYDLETNSYAYCESSIHTDDVIAKSRSEVSCPKTEKVAVLPNRDRSLCPK
ncbi:hypothetical protein C8R43DRAFT_947978 [Mycena crocata]|nr:hypothetical protein C8R43DRAFT_947978 [Mycena crocata]